MEEEEGLIGRRGRWRRRKECPWKGQLKEAITSRGTENPAWLFLRKEPLLFLQGTEQKISWLAWGQSSCSFYRDEIHSQWLGSWYSLMCLDFGGLKLNVLILLHVYSAMTTKIMTSLVCIRTYNNVEFLHYVGPCRECLIAHSTLFYMC